MLETTRVIIDQINCLLPSRMESEGSPAVCYVGGTQVFFQRPPYRNHAEVPQHKTSHVTRFISLASVSQVHSVAVCPYRLMTPDTST
jgi:hypothetical protein